MSIPPGPQPGPARAWVGPALMWAVTLAHYALSVAAFAAAYAAAQAPATAAPSPTAPLLAFVWRIVALPIASYALAAPTTGQAMPAWLWLFLNSLAWGALARLLYTRYRNKRLARARGAAA